MKKHFFALIFVILNILSIKGQNVDSTITNRAILEMLQKMNATSRSTYLSALFAKEFQKLTGLPSMPYTETQALPLNINFGEKPNAIEQQKINADLLIYLEQLNASALINQSQYLRLKAEINENKYFHKLQLLSNIIEIVTNEEAMNDKKTLKAIANELKSYKIISTKYEQLIRDIENNSLTDFLEYCDKALIVSRKEVTDKPEEDVKNICKKLENILPELKCSDFSFQIVPDEYDYGTNNKYYRLITSLFSNGKKYQQISSYSWEGTGDTMLKDGKISIEEYYKLFNKVLLDLGSPYRLHLAFSNLKVFTPISVNESHIALIPLTKEQAQIPNHQSPYFLLSNENFNDTLTTEKIANTLEAYQKIGLFAHLTSEQIAKAKEEVAMNEHTNFNDILLHFPYVVLKFDYELENIDDPYAAFVKSYAFISRNEFTPTDISDNFHFGKNKKVKLKFRFNGKNYEKTFKVQTDWLDVDFCDFMKLVATENKLKGQFYHLYGDEVMVIYLTPEQYNYLKENKLAIFGE